MQILEKIGRKMEPLQLPPLRGHANSDFTQLETSNFKNPQF